MKNTFIIFSYLNVYLLIQFLLIESESLEGNRKAKQKGAPQIEDKNEFLNKLEKLFNGKNFKIIEKIINQMVKFI